jgi:hypothetical protein
MQAAGFAYAGQPFVNGRLLYSMDVGFNCNRLAEQASQLKYKTAAADADSSDIAERDQQSAG